MKSTWIIILVKSKGLIFPQLNEVIKKKKKKKPYIYFFCPRNRIFKSKGLRMVLIPLYLSITSFHALKMSDIQDMHKIKIWMVSLPASCSLLVIFIAILTCLLQDFTSALKISFFLFFKILWHLNYFLENTLIKLECKRILR